MEKNKDSSVKDKIADSFKELARKKAIDKITIKEITNLTGVIRPTFYNHFQDKYELLEWIINNDLIIPCRNEIVNMQFEAGVIGFLEKMAEDPEFYQSCIRLEGQNSFEEILTNCFRKMILEFVDEKTLKDKLWFKWLTPKVVGDFFAEAVTYAIIEWVKTDMKVPKEEIWDCFVYLANHSILEMIIESRKER